MNKVDFFVIGAQKCGTTALDAYLRKHPHVQMSAKKEVHYFDDDSVDWSSPAYSELHKHFCWDAEPTVIRGEATPIYLYWPSSIERLKAYNPGAKLIVGLRHPSFRAYSGWRMETARGNETLTFGDAISAPGQARLQTVKGQRLHSYIDRGFYARQIQKLLRCFDRNQVQFYRTDELWNNPGDVAREIERFLGLAPCSPKIQPLPYIKAIKQSRPGRLPDQFRAQLMDTYLMDIALTAGLTGMNLSDWLDVQYEEPMSDVVADDIQDASAAA